MINKVARTGLKFFLALLIAVPFPLLAQTQTSTADQTTDQTTSNASTSNKDTSKDKKKKDNDKDKDKKAAAVDCKNKPKNCDVDNIGSRNINKGSINFISLDKEIAMGRQLAAEVERQVKLIDDPAINEYVNRVGQNMASETV
jgi:hypothetical protein